MSQKREKQITGYLLDAELAEEVRNQARREQRWPANVVTDALKTYLRKAARKPKQPA